MLLRLLKAVSFPFAIIIIIIFAFIDLAYWVITGKNRINPIVKLYIKWAFS